MANSIRTPRQGVTTGSRRIAQAVDDEDWQEFRVSMKGKSTEVKIGMLQRYDFEMHGGENVFSALDIVDCDYCIRVDNYIKALCRGGQLYPGESLETIIMADWKPRIKR